MFRLHGTQVVLRSRDDIVPAGRELKHRDIRGRSESTSLRTRLFQEVFRVTEEPVPSLCHIRLIDLNASSLRNLCGTRQRAIPVGASGSFPRPDRDPAVTILHPIV
jgi:hypothetical protein